MWGNDLHVVLASDHAGFHLKEHLREWLEGQGAKVEDYGPSTLDPHDDYPVLLFPAVRRVRVLREGGVRAFGVVLGGSGQGEAIVANKVPGIRAAVFYGGLMDIVRLAREHNDAWVLSLGARFLSVQEAQEAVATFLSTPFSGEERHVRRISQIGKEECR